MKRLSVFSKEYVTPIFKGIGVVIMSIVMPFFSSGQKDTSKRQTIDIISSYKPSLRNVSKINLTASPINVDTTTPNLNYNIPPLYLNFAYKQITLKPLALNIDTFLQVGSRKYIKFGLGNYSTPFIQSGLSFGDIKNNLLNLSAGFISSKGKIEHQDFSSFNIKGAGSFFYTKNEIYGGFGYMFNQFYQYGFDHTLYNFSKDAIRKSYNDFSVNLGFRNYVLNENKVNYNPNIEVHYYSIKNGVHETETSLNIPIEKTLSDHLIASFLLKEDISVFKNTLSALPVKINKNLFQLKPALNYHSNLYIVHVGLIPAFESKRTFLLPDISTSIQLRSNLLLETGLKGSITKNNFRILSGENPYMEYPEFINNSREVKFYSGLRSKIRNHMDLYGAISFIRMNNIPLFVNDTISGKGFYVKNESKMNDLNIHGEVRFYSQNKFSINSVLDVNTYSGLADNANAWGLIPLKFTGEIRWDILKDVVVKGSLHAFSGIPVILKHKIEKRLPSAADLSLGMDVKLSESFYIWFEINNLLNNKYQRWYNYDVYGIHALGGLIYHFK